MILAWHFVGDKLRNGASIPPDGEWLEYPGRLIMCQSGLHASCDPFDALRYAPGPILCRVECDGIIIEEKDKLVCTRRRIIRRLDATEGLLFFARMQALSVVHLWEAPDIVLDYLMSGSDQEVSDAARAADAAHAAHAAAYDAAYAAYAAARAAAYDATLDAANAAVYAAALDTARVAFNELVEEAFDEHRG